MIHTSLGDDWRLIILSEIYIDWQDKELFYINHMYIIEEEETLKFWLNVFVKHFRAYMPNSN